VVSAKGRESGVAVLAWVRDEALGRRLLRCAGRAGVACRLSGSARAFRRELARTGVGVAVVRAGLVDRGSWRALAGWLAAEGKKGGVAQPAGAAVPRPPGSGSRLLLAIGGGKGSHALDDLAHLLLPARPTDALLVSVLRSAAALRGAADDRAIAVELQRTKTFLERVVDASPDGIVAADMKGRIILFNRGAERITGWTAGEVVGRMNIADLYGSREMAREILRRLRSPEHGEVGRLGQTRARLMNRSGEAVPVALSAAIIYDGRQELATCGVFADLRDLLRVEERLAQAQAQLHVTEKQAIVSEVSGAMAHELNQPLMSVMGNAELLRRLVREMPKAGETVETILREAERMADIVKRIGRLSRYETKRYVGNTQILDLERSADDAK
jgi:PAS domain S-box-containing protein